MNMPEVAKASNLDVKKSSPKLAEVYIQRSAIITKGEKGSEMLPKKFALCGIASKLPNL